MKPSGTSFWFATLCCFTTFAFFGWYEVTKPVEGRFDFASTAAEIAVKKIDTANKSLGALSSYKEDMTCACTMGATPGLIDFEKPEDCGADRNYLDNEIKAFAKIDKNGYFSKARNDAALSAQLPRKCAVYIMRRFWKDRALTAEEKREADIEYNRTAEPTKQRDVKEVSGYRNDPHLFSKCDKDPTGKPERYGHKACVTEPYVNLIYNSMMDVADCLGVPPKFIAPKLSNESGLHVNAFGLVNDGGIGQFTDQALEDVAQNYANFKGRIVNSDKESCKRINSIPGAVPASATDILAKDENRCSAISAPPNPLRSMVYYGIFYHSTKRNSNGAWNRYSNGKTPGQKSVEQLMDDAKISNFDKEKIKEMIFVMAYNSGPGRPPGFLREWLKYRIETLKKYPIKASDFDMNYWPEPAQTKAKAGAARMKAMKKKTPLTLAEYLFVYKDSLYIPAVKAQARVIDKAMGEGTCTEQNFLEI